MENVFFACLFVFLKHCAYIDVKNSWANLAYECMLSQGCFPRPMWKILNSILFLCTNAETSQLSQTFSKVNEFSSHLRPILNVSSLQYELLFFPEAVIHFQRALYLGDLQDNLSRVIWLNHHFSFANENFFQSMHAHIRGLTPY